MRDPNMIFLPPYVSPYQGATYTPPTDEQWQAIWSARVRENELRRKTREPITGEFIPMFLRPMAGG